MTERQRRDPDHWAPMSVDEAVAVFRGAPFRWWIAGGLIPTLGRRRRDFLASHIPEDHPGYSLLDFERS